MRFRIILCMTLMTVFGNLSKVYAAVDRALIIKEFLEKQGIKFIELDGVGFGLEDSGSHRLNRVAKSVNDKMSTFVVLDIRNTKELGAYIPNVKALFIKVNEENIADLVAWRPSSVRSTMLHELRHAFLRKTFDEKNKITPLAVTLAGKKSDALTSLTNPYYEYLNFQEFSTFTLELRHLYQGLNTTEDQVSKLFKVTTTLYNFSDTSLEALQYFDKNLEKEEVTFSEKFDDRTDKKIRYIELQSPDWKLSFLIDFNFDTNKTQLSVDYVRNRITQTLNVVERINSLAHDLREIIKDENKEMLAVIKKPIDKLNQIARLNYKILIPRCGALFRN